MRKYDDPVQYITPLSFRGTTRPKLELLNGCDRDFVVANEQIWFGFHSKENGNTC